MKEFRVFKDLKAKLKAQPKKIIFTEGTDERVLEAASRLLASTFLTPVLVGNPKEVSEAAEEAGFNIRGAKIIDPNNYERMDEMIEEFLDLRRGKGISREDALKTLKKSNYFGTMLVRMGYADCLLGGATYTTADTVRPALQLIKTAPGSKSVTSCFILVRPTASGSDEVLAMADCAINIDPDADTLAQTAILTAETSKSFGLDPRVAFLSYSTFGSAEGEDVDKVRKAAALTREQAPELPVEGEVQFDAAVSPEVALTKCPGSVLGGTANVFVFPDINSGNICYKIAQRFGNFQAYGPILLGLNAPINDLSRGCNADEVYSMAIITAAQALRDDYYDDDEF